MARVNADHLLLDPLSAAREPPSISRRISKATFPSTMKATSNIERPRFSQNTPLPRTFHRHFENVIARPRPLRKICERVRLINTEQVAQFGFRPKQVLQGVFI